MLIIFVYDLSTQTTHIPVPFVHYPTMILCMLLTTPPTSSPDNRSPIQPTCCGTPRFCSSNEDDLGSAGRLLHSSFRPRTVCCCSCSCSCSCCCCCCCWGLAYPTVAFPLTFLEGEAVTPLPRRLEADALAPLGACTRLWPSSIDRLKFCSESLPRCHRIVSPPAPFSGPPNTTMIQRWYLR